MRYSRTTRLTILLLASLVLLGGCGQSGPLYLPDEEQQEQQEQQAQ